MLAFFKTQLWYISATGFIHRNSLMNLIFCVCLLPQPSTTENVAVYIWKNLKTTMSRPDLLYEVKILETDKNSVIYRGDVSDSGRRCGGAVSSDSDQRCLLYVMEHFIKKGLRHTRGKPLFYYSNGINLDVFFFVLRIYINVTISYHIVLL